MRRNEKHHFVPHMRALAVLKDLPKYRDIREEGDLRSTSAIRESINMMVADAVRVIFWLINEHALLPVEPEHIANEVG